MNKNRFLFVTCVNNEGLYATCVRHIKQLVVPQNYTIELFPIRGAKSMAVGYNLALSKNAKFKIYLHQDTFIMNRSFLHHILKLFISEPRLGMLGMIGSKDCPPNGHWLEGKEQQVGKLFLYAPQKIYGLLNFKEMQTRFEPVAVIDGFLMATQYDIPWRADLFTGFHLYDASQCMEFTSRGYLIGVPKQEQPWTMHFMNHHVNYEEWRRNQKIFQDHYMKK